MAGIEDAGDPNPWQELRAMRTAEVDAAIAPLTDPVPRAEPSMSEPANLAFDPEPSSPVTLATPAFEHAQVANVAIPLRAMPPAPPIASPGARFFMIATGVFVLVLWLMPLEGHSLSEWLGYLGGIDFVRSYGSVVCAILFICLGLLPFRSRNRAPFATLVAISWLAVAPGSALSGVLHPAHQLLALFAFVTLPLGVFLSSKLSDTPLRWLSPLALVTAYLLPTVRGSFLKIAYVHVNSAEVDDVAQGTLLFMPLFLWIIGELIRFFPMMTATERRVEPGIILTTIFLCWPSMMFALWAQLAHVPVLYRVAPVWTLMSLVAILTLLEIYQFRDST